ncbi:hypothetical protein OB905_12640 [Halobacteria archaeon AArc-dxtr1]|nr:hypothetical protein [Halobacteria archaeon AArc-dxtr1]
MPKPSRRQLLSGTATAVPAVLAGCVTEARSSFEAGSDDGDDGSGDDSDSRSDSENGDTTGGDDDAEDGTGEYRPTNDSVDAWIETVDADCGGPTDHRVAAEHDGESVVVTGALTASNPCHEAIVTGSEYDDGNLRLQIDVKSTLEDGEVCVECVGIISYEATAKLADGAEPDTVVVDHATGDEHVVELE